MSPPAEPGLGFGHFLAPTVPDSTAQPIGLGLISERPPACRAGILDNRPVPVVKESGHCEADGDGGDDEEGFEGIFDGDAPKFG